MEIRPHVSASLVMANLELGRPPWSEAGMKKIGDDRYSWSRSGYEAGWTPDAKGAG
jgi:hypothetical protein